MMYTQHKPRHVNRGRRPSQFTPVVKGRDHFEFDAESSDELHRKTLLADCRSANISDVKMLAPSPDMGMLNILNNFIINLRSVNVNVLLVTEKCQ